MVELTCFPLAGNKVDIAEMVGVHYCSFGIQLLQDRTGDVVSAMEKELGKNALDINHKILRLWLQGKGRQPVTWDTLIAVLQDIGLNCLAKDIETCYYGKHCT